MLAIGDNTQRIDDLAAILWAHILDLDRVRTLKRRPSLDKRLKVAHCLTQLSGAFLKVVEANDLAAEVEAIKLALARMEARQHDAT